MRELILGVLYGVLPATAAALLFVGLLGSRWIGLAAGLGLLVTHGLLRKTFPAWPHVLLHGDNDANLWLCWTAVATGLLVAAQPRKSWSPAVVVPPGLLLLAAQFWLVVTNPRRRWDLTDTVVNHGLFAGLAACAWLGVRRLVVARPAPLTAWVLAGCLGADAALLHLGGSTFQGQLAGAAATAFAAAAGTALWRHGLAFETSTAFAFAWLHCGLLALGFHLSELPPTTAAIAALAPAALALGAGGGAARFWLGVLAAGGAFGAAFALVLSG